MYICICTCVIYLSLSLYIYIYMYQCFVGWPNNHFNNLHVRILDIHFRGVQWEGGAVDRGSII